MASHYAAPVERHLSCPAQLKTSPDDGAATLTELNAGDVFLMLDDSLGWAWGYGGPDRLVGYVPTAVLKR